MPLDLLFCLNFLFLFPVTSSFYGTCENGESKVLISKRVHNPGGIITSGSFDRQNNYPPLQNCIWSIRVPPGFRISLSILHFDLERGRDNVCPYDRVEFWDGNFIPDDASAEIASKSFENSSVEISELCGFFPRKDPIVSTGSSMTIKFVTDAVVQRSGFCFKWKAISVESDLLIAEEVGDRRNELLPSPSQGDTSGMMTSSEPSGCGGPKYLRQGSGHIKSPNYGISSYYPNLDCKWVVSAPAGKIVRVNLIDADIESDVSCRFDYLSLYDGASEYASVIKRLCGRPKPQIIKTSSNTVFLRFRTDGTAQGRGFLIEYSFTDPKS